MLASGIFFRDAHPVRLGTQYPLFITLFVEQMYIKDRINALFWAWECEKSSDILCS